jgi:hypothetical protein
MAGISLPNSGDDQRKAFELADGWAKLIATLASATVALTATFIKDIFPDNDPLSSKAYLFGAWAMLLASVLLAPLVLGSLVSELSANRSAGPDIQSPTIRILSILQFLAFFAGLALFAVFVGKNI